MIPIINTGGEMMNAEQRRKEIIGILSASDCPVSAFFLAERLNVSRQVIVGDIALLRTAGANIIATPRGYLLQSQEKGLRCSIACIHDAEGMRQELFAIVDNGCKVIDVVVEHPVYGQITGMLELGTRTDVIRFLQKCSQARPLSSLTGGLHFHTILCPDEEACMRVKSALSDLNILLPGS
jgi:transcriptional regulator of NAD metabolism